jgi:hypothetical protein
MPVEHVNRKGHIYYLLVGKTATGKPLYYVSRKLRGTPAEAIPDGYEIHESPAEGRVHVRKIRPSRLLPSEREQLVQMVQKLTSKKRFFVEIEGDALVVYWPGTDPEASSRLIDLLFGGSASAINSMADWTANRTRYSPELRFALLDEDRRLFSAERWCYRGSIDRWIALNGPATLAELAEQYAPHLGQESFFELL